MIQIRDATIKDVDFIIETGRNEENFRVSGSEDSIFWKKHNLIQWVQSDIDVLLVVEEDNKIFGFVLGTMHNVTEKGTVENIWVDDTMRKTGHGTELIQKCIDQLLKNGAKYICAYTKDEGTVRFLEKNGFDKGSLFTWMEKEI